ncbi:phospholipid-transporting ATPase ID-like isoform X3 [Pomacea canaliculata]|uniref:phospholipid-transporting ATPase ID-like isoform X3 n=1 Tax=Pomacea canaliculata TaxID=400727 RepID=UPI000D7374B5|nr:phospholipid-transporting ATPase ID-like isoform X3 [Pomacea canaliculata]
MPAMKFWTREKPPELERRIKVNDAEYNAQFEYAQNHISTSKYNILTFVPKNLFEQFQRLANAYFLGLLILQLIPAISSLNPIATVIPLVFVLSISAIKEAIDDITRCHESTSSGILQQRHRSDAQVNNRTSYVLRKGEIVEERWHKVSVGDIVKLKNNDFVAADLLLLSTSEPHSLCYIETAELDGETNLKVRQALDITAEMKDDHALMGAFDAEIISEPPNNRLSKFEGKMVLKDQTYSLDNEKILLRGCILRNTAWCYGVVIFAGRDTKLMMNSGKTKFKRTHIDRFMNFLIIGIFLFLVTMCLICTIACGVWEAVTGYDFQAFLPWESFVHPAKARGATTIAVLVFLSYIIILNTVVPISLYVSVEIIRLAHSLWINWDIKMYYEKKDSPAKARTTTLNEELGQVEYIFSDKTGTLTQNIMTFNKCSIDGKSYGDPLDREGNPLEITERTPKVDFSGNPYAEKSFDFYDFELLKVVNHGDQNAHAFFRLLALCHTVMPEVHEDGTLEYQAQSPDEGALVSAARNFGFVFKSRTPSTITIEALGVEEKYELLCILDFNNVRKRMSVLVRRNQKITLFCKGADNIIFDRLSPACAELKELTSHHLNDFAQDGLRTLCLAYKDIDDSFYEKWKIRHHEASTSLENRDEKLDTLYEEIETDMILIGASAIEDKLQDGVPDAIANLALADIKIWVLTGDKQETAINIGYSCRLLTDDMEEPFIIDGETPEDVDTQLKHALEEIHSATSRKTPDHVVMGNGQTTYNGATGRIITELDEVGEFAVVINGHSLAFALKPELEATFLDLACRCKAVICCRVTPLQKAMVVDLVKRHKKCVTLAIGDGANDVSMIKMAHIGIGISGQEGMQAVLAADYAISQFRYLERLLLVHGRWSYLRMCKFLKYFFYKNFAFTLCHFWFAFFCGFSAQTLFDPFFISLYNVFYTSLPILVLGVFDQDVDDTNSLRYPKLYLPGIKNALFNKRVFFWSVIEGILSSLVLFFIPYGSFLYGSYKNGEDRADIQSFGTVVAATLVIAVNLRCALDMSYWTGFNHFVVWGSIIYYFCFQLAFYSDAIHYDYVGTAFAIFSCPIFWFTMLLTCAILIVPMVAYRFYQTSVHPTLSDRVRLRQRMRKSKSKGRDLHIRRSSTFRRSRRSLRSGYAFAHQAGFGELITSGINMRAETSSPVKLTKVQRMSSDTLDQHRLSAAVETVGISTPVANKGKKDNRSPLSNPSNQVNERKRHSHSSENEQSIQPQFSASAIPVTAAVEQSVNTDSGTWTAQPKGEIIFVERL